MTGIYTLLEDNAMFFREITGLNSDELTNVLLGTIALLFIVLLILFTSLKGRGKVIRELEASGRNVEKKESSTAQNLQVYKNQNRKLRDEIVRLKREFLEERTRVKQKARSLDEKATELEKGLLKVKAMEETVNMHRTKIGILEKKNRELSSMLEGSSSDLEERLNSEKERYKTKIEELKNETKEMMAAFMERKEAEIAELKKENEGLRKELEGHKDES